MPAQTTQGIIAGRVTRLEDQKPITPATVSWTNATTNATGKGITDRSGYYALAPLSPGTYVIRVDARGYQAGEVHELELAVAGRLDLNIRLRALSETLESRSSHSVPIAGSPYRVTIYGPDAVVMNAPIITPHEDRSLLDSTRSQVIDPVQIRDLAFFGRDTYTMLVTQPGVSSDGGTARGLGLAINGQRPSAANFMLDGIESNNYLLSGPLLSIAPEVVQEYRVSTSNFSAEYGSSAGYLANAVTRSGTNAWHGITWWNFNHESLDANGFQENRLGLGRQEFRERQTGYQIGGPLRRDRYFVSSSFEYFHSFGHNAPITVSLPTVGFLDVLAADSLAHSLMDRFRPPAVQNGNELASPYTVVPPVTVDRWSGMGRLDGVSRSGRHRILARGTVARISRPDFIWSPYRDFVSGLNEPAMSLAGGLTSSLRPRLTNEIRLGWSRNAIEWDRAHPEIPTLIDASLKGILLPGSLAFYAFRNRNHTIEFADQAFRASGRHILRFGGGLLLRSMEGFLTAGRDGRYSFQTLIDFQADLPSRFSTTLDRPSLPGLRVPDFEREYRYHQASGFVQDTFRASPGWTLNLGLRYEYFGAPANTGATKDAKVVLGEGSGFPAMLSGARLAFPSEGSEPLYSASHLHWSARVGVSHNVLGDGRTVVRGGWGVFFDRPFDNLWQDARNNNLALATFDYEPGPGEYLASISSVLPRYVRQPVTSGFPPLTLFQQHWKNGYAMAHFLGVQQRIAENWSLETAVLGSMGRRLVATDEINRPFSISSGEATTANYARTYNPTLPVIEYRGSQGSSNYNAFTGVLRYRSSRRLFYLAYTWSHSIDNQSDPLAGDFFDLNFTSLTPTARTFPGGTFSRQFDSRADRGNADFDQRHNLVFYSIWDLSAVGHRWHWLLRGWKFSQMAAIRSGFPFSVYAPSTEPFTGGTILNNRADTTALGVGVTNNRQTVPGGFQILNAASFTAPENGMLGSSGRNAFRGPGFFSADISLSRSFQVLPAKESARITLRADVFNFLNHTNLGQPDALITSPTFGVALYGRTGKDTGFPALAPFRETARQIQLLVRFEF